MGFMSPPSPPKPPPPSAPLVEIDSKTRGAQEEMAQRMALMRGIASTWNTQSMMGKPVATAAAEKKTTLG